MAAAEICILPSQNGELPASLGRLGVDAFLAQPLDVIRAMIRVDDVERAVAVLEAFRDERHEHPILLVARMKKGTDVAGTIQHGSRQVNGTLP
jgi:hypothetical protein